MYKQFKQLVFYIRQTIHLIISYLPGETGNRLRYNYWQKRLKYLGSNVLIDTGVYFQNPQYIHIDNNCWIDKNVMILAGRDESKREKIRRKNTHYIGSPGEVHLGQNIHLGPSSIISGISAGVYISDDCGFSAGCKLYSFSHHYRSKSDPSNTRYHFGPRVSQERQCLIVGPIFIGCNTGFALNAVVLPGVSIPRNCFVTINSVVYPGRFKQNSILSGSPAKQIEARFRPR